MTTIDPRVGLDAGLVFFGSRDFLLAWEVMQERFSAPEVQTARAPWPMRASATCLAFSLELALKARLVLDGRQPSKEHRYSILFRRLSHEAQEDLASRVNIEGRSGITVGRLFEILKDCDGSFEQWRYVHERLARMEGTTLFTGYIVAVIRAVHASIVQLRPDFAPWPGVISG